MSYYKSENKISNADWLRSVKSQMGVVNGSRIDESDDPFGKSPESPDEPYGKPIKSLSDTISSFKDVAKEGGIAAALGLGEVIEALKMLDPADRHTIVGKIKGLIRSSHPTIAGRVMASERRFSQGMS
jgi:hypothetical protein